MREIGKAGDRNNREQVKSKLRNKSGREREGEKERDINMENREDGKPHEDVKSERERRK